MLDKYISQKIQNHSALGNLILRITLGLIFVNGGIGKLFLGGASGLANIVWGQLWLAYLVGIVELVAGIFIIIGFLSRLSALSLAIIMLFAIALVHNPITNPGELGNALIRLALIGGFAKIILCGSGKYALKKD